MQPEIPVIDGGFLMRIPNMNQSMRPKENNGRSETNEQKLLAIFIDVSFSKEDAAKTLGITVSGAYKLLQRMCKQGLLIARKQGRQWMHSAPSIMGKSMLPGEISPDLANGAV